MSIDTRVKPPQPVLPTKPSVQQQEIPETNQEYPLKIIDGKEYKITCRYFGEPHNCMAPTYNNGVTIDWCSENHQTKCPTHNRIVERPSGR